MNLKKPVKSAVDKGLKEKILSRFLRGRHLKGARSRDVDVDALTVDVARWAPAEAPKKGGPAKESRPKPRLDPKGKAVRPAAPADPVPAAPVKVRLSPSEGREEQIIYTAIDKIIEIVESKKEVPLEEVSAILSIAPDRMEVLAKILDEHGILQLHYPSNPFARPVLRSLSKHDFKRLGRQD